MLWWAAAPPPGDDDQQREADEEPRQGPSSVGDQGVARILFPGARRRCRLSRKRIEQRQDFARAGRAALVGAARIGILDLAVSLVAAAAHDALAGRGEANADVGKRPLELGQNVATQIDIARVFRRQANGDEQRLAKPGEHPLIGGWKRVAPILGEVDRCPDLRGQCKHGGNGGHDRRSNAGPWCAAAPRDAATPRTARQSRRSRR